MRVMVVADGVRTHSACKFHCVALVRDWCGEAPVWSAALKALYWTDINRCLIHRITPADEQVRTWRFSEPVNALALTTNEYLLAVVLASKLVL
jgi:sugar lactone lactonase YvrE